MERIKVLLVDDDQSLLDVSKIYLERLESKLEIYTTLSATDAYLNIKDDSFDVIVSDYQMSGMDGLELLKKIREESMDIPFIIFTGKGREEVAIQALNLGADYYLQKGGDPKSQFRELINLIEKSVEKKKSEIALRKSEEKFSKIFQYSLNSIFIYNIRERKFIDINENFTKMFNYDRTEIIGKKMTEIKIFARPTDYEYFEKTVLEKNEILDFETLLVGKNARVYPVLVSATQIDIEGELSVLVNIKDISEIVQALEELKEGEQKYKFLFNESPAILFRLNLFEIKKLIENMTTEEQLFFKEQLFEDPQQIEDYIHFVKVIEMNKTAMEFLEIDSQDELEKGILTTILQKNLDFIAYHINELLAGNKIVAYNGSITNRHNETLFITSRLSIAPGSEETWSKILLSILDVTEIEKARATIQKERKAFKLITEAAINSSNKQELCDNILFNLVNSLGFQFGTIRYYDEKQQVLIPVSFHGMDAEIKELVKPIKINDETSKLITRLKRREVIVIDDASKREFFDASKILQKLETKSYVFFPLLKGNNDYLGSISMGSKENKKLTIEDKLFFETVAEMISVVLQK